MEYRKLGQTEISVSVMAMGCWAITGDSTWGEQDESESIATIRAALDVGINFFDTAEMYGAGYSEELLSKALTGKRDEVVLASKLNQDRMVDPSKIREACEGSLRRLGTDYLDLYQIHWNHPDALWLEVFEALENLRTEGKIRAIGVCNLGTQDMQRIPADLRCCSNQLPYSMLWRAIEYDIESVCIEKGLGILCYSPLAQGLLAGKFFDPDSVPEGRARTRWFSSDRPQTRHGEPGQEELTFSTLEKIQEISDGLHQPMARLALDWLLQRPGVTSVLVGARSPNQIKENARAADLALAPTTIQELTELTEDLKKALGPNPDMWQSALESRII